MKNFTVFILMVFYFNSIQAETYTFEVEGEWKEETKWDVYPGQTISQSDTIIIAANCTTTGAITIDGVIIVNESIAFETFFWMFIINGSLVNNGLFTSNSDLIVSGDIINNDKFIIEFNTVNLSSNSSFVSNGQ